MHSLVIIGWVALQALVSSVTAQDAGEGFIFKCDQPGAFALTFDDGPGLYTTSLLKILQEKQIKSTFFLIGKQVAEPAFSKHLKQILDEGHQIGSHTYSHPSLNKISPEMIKEEMLKTEKAIEAASGVVPAMMRPPYGDCNEQCRVVMKELGYQVIQWNIDSQDWTFMEQPSKFDTLKANLLNAATNGNPKVDNFVSLQHEILNFSVERTPEIIDGIKAKGYHFVTVNDCLGNRFPMYKNRSNPPSENVTIPATSAVSSTTSIASSATQVVSSDAQQTSSPTAPSSNQGTQPSSSAAPDVQAKGKSNSSSVVGSNSAMALLISAFAFWIHI